MNERIKELRKVLGLTQQQFADKIGIKRTTIATYENGRNTPIDAVISLICLKFNVNETWLREGSGDMFISSDIKVINSMNERIKELRKALGLTQQQFADKIGTSRTNIGKYEASAGTPSKAIISLICREFNVNETWLRDGFGDMFQSHISSIQPIDLKFLAAYNKLNASGKEKAYDLIELLVKVPDFTINEEP